MHAIFPVVPQLHRTESLKFSDKLSLPGTLAPHLAFRKTRDTDNCIHVTTHTVGDASVPPTTESSSRIQNEEKTRQDPAAYVTPRTLSQQICQPYSSLHITTTSHWHALWSFRTRDMSEWTGNLLIQDSLHITLDRLTEQHPLQWA